MAAPSAGPLGTTAVVFDPTGGNANPIGAPWVTNVTSTGHSDWQRSSNLLAPAGAGGHAQAYKSDDATFGVGYEIWFPIAAKAITNDNHLDIYTMITDPFAIAGAGVTDLYYLEFLLKAGADTWDIGRVNNSGAGSSLAAQQTQEITAGDYACISIVNNGGNPRVRGHYWNFVATGPWTTIIDGTDSSGSKLTLAGFMGLEAFNNSAWRIGLIQGGAIPSDVDPNPPTQLGGRGAMR